MAIKALFETGKNEITVEGLYQWDYGQVLEIESSDLGTEIVEVHFACTNMTEAVVRPCTLTNGIGSVTIPDDCLEQSTTIIAWVYTIEGTQGKTRKVIYLPVIARTRPGASRNIPPEISDRYTELITEVNEAVNGLESGNVVVERANNATKADHATAAGNASTANHAMIAENARTADMAAYARCDESGNYLTTYMRCTPESEEYYDDGSDGEESILPGGLIMFRIEGTQSIRVMTELSNYSTSYSQIFYDEVTMGKDTGIFPMRLVGTHVSMGQYRVKIQRFLADRWVDLTSAEYNASIYFKYLSSYPVG